MKILSSINIKNLSPKWLLSRGARLVAIIALARHALVDEEGHEFDDVFSFVPCFARSNSVLRGVGTEPGIFRVLLDFLTDTNFDLHFGFANSLLDISQSAPEVRLGGHDPQLGESVSLRPLDGSSRDAQSRRWIAGLFLGVFHRNTLFDTDVDLGVNPTAGFPRLLRRDLGDTPIGQNRFRYSERECNNACGSQASPPEYEVGKGPISDYLKYNILFSICKGQQKISISAVYLPLNPMIKIFLFCF